MTGTRPTASASPPRDEEYWKIPQESGIPLVDAEVDKIVEFLADTQWRLPFLGHHFLIIS